MTPFRQWLVRVLQHGESILEEPPRLGKEERPTTLEVLRNAFEQHALDIAGPPIPFDAKAGLAAAELVAESCWQLVGTEEDRALAFAYEPSSASAHLSVDVLFRFLPTVYRRAHARAHDGALTTSLDALLRAWPLSGVLADLDGEPTTALGFFDHPGLQLLYAERLVATGRAGWVPNDGKAREWVERVFFERGKPVPSLPPKEEAGV